MLILGLDTATAMSTVALVAIAGSDADRPELRIEKSALVGNRHAETTPVQIQTVLSEAGVRAAQLDLVVVGVGPGPYTSLRVGIALAKAIALAVDVPVVGYCTLDVIAAEVAPARISRGPFADDAVDDAAEDTADDQSDGFGVATDARRSEIYWAEYGNDGKRLAGPRVGRPASVLDHDGAPRAWAGDGFERFGELAQQRQLRLLPQRYPSTAVLIDQVLLLARPVPAEAGPEAALVPATLRDLIAESARIDLRGPAWLDDQSGDGATKQVPVGRLLAPLPLYLRRPDAAPPKGLPAALPLPKERNSPEGSQVKIRPMRACDIASAMRIERGVFPSEPWSIETFRAELAGAPASRYYLVAESDGQIVGYGGLSWPGGPDVPGAVGPDRVELIRVDSTDAGLPGPSTGDIASDVSDIQTVAVIAGSRGRGIGRALVAGLLAHSDAIGYASCMLEVRADNPRAIALYESFGFEQVAVRRRYYRDGTDALIMRRVR